MNICFSVHAGTDRKLTYWDAITGDAIRELEGSDKSPLLCLAVHPNGNTIATGAADKLVKLWNYDQGTCFAVGQGHTGEVTRCAFSPDGTMLVTADTYGTLMFWDLANLKDGNQPCAL